MKKLFFLNILVIVFGGIKAQTMQVVPQGFNFQAQVRDVDGKIKSNENVELRIALYQGQYASDADYTENQSLTTNNFGLINTVVGNGQSNDLITDIDFTSAQYWIKIELKEASAYQLIHFAALWSVPYAIAAGNVQESPAGSIVAFGGNLNSIPNGWLPCDGREIKRDAYPKLFEAIITNWGHGDASTTFNIPDLRGVFLRGVDGGAENDPDVEQRMASKDGGNTGDNVGSVQNDAIRNIEASVNTNYTILTSPGGAMSITNGPTSSVGGEDIRRFNNYMLGFDASKVVPTASDNRPINSSVWYIIKY